jgi:hypothetical protein
MKKKLVFLSLFLSLNSAWSVTSTPAPTNNNKNMSETVQVDVEGLNCALCSESMKTSMLEISGAHDIEPRLECGRIYLEVTKGQRPNRWNLSNYLMTKGFNLKNITITNHSIAEIRKTPPEAC